MNSTPSRRDVLRGASAAGVGVLLLGSETAVAADADRHIVGTATTGATAEAQRRADSVHRVLEFGDIGSAVAGRFSEASLENLAKNPNVRYIEADGTMHAIAQTLPWGVDRVDADVLHSNGETGNGADVAIIDTGIDDDHPDLQVNVGAGKAYVDCKGPNCNHPWSDDNDHGTHCAGIADAVNNTEGVVGVSTEATLHAVKVLDKNGSGSFSDVAAGIEYTADQGWDVGSMSLGASSGSQTVKDACQYAYNIGVLLVAAAGNDGPCTDCVGYPAAYSTVIAVSSTDSDDSLSSFSSTGPEVELAAPGGSIESTVIGGYDTFSGTSMACPHVSGAGAQLMANGHTNTEARNRLNSTAEDIGLANNEQGNGLLDAEAAVSGGSTESAPTVDSLSASEVETSDSDAVFDVDWSVGDADGNLSSVDLTLTDDTDGGTEDNANVNVSGDTASGTTQLAAAGDDGSGNSYTVDVTVTDGKGNTGSGSTSVSETESTNTAPSASIDSLTDRSNPRWDRFEVNWSANDADGNLDTVVVELLDGGGVLDSVTNDVSGSTASGVDEVRSKSTASDIVVTATDTDGETGSDSGSV